MQLGCVWKVASVWALHWHMCLYAPAEDRFVSGSIHATGGWETDMVTAMLRALRRHPNSTLLDIGGNVGYYTLAAAAAGFDVDVFEPVPANAAMIQQSVARNGFTNVRLHTGALGDRHGEVGMGLSADANQGGVRHGAAVRSQTMLPSLPMDSVRAPETRPLYIKIDIEGSECEALQGMTRFWTETRQIVGLNMEFAQARARCCAAWMAPGGFFQVLHRRHNLCPVGRTFSTLCTDAAWDLMWDACPPASPRDRRDLARGR